MIVTIDVGNSNICLGAYEDGVCRFTARIATDIRREADQYAVEIAGVFRLYGVDTGAIEGVAIASVVPAINGTLVRAIRHFTSTEPMILGLQHTGELVIDIENPAELGTDIIASAIAAIANHPLPAIIIDMGTATKLTAVDAAGHLQGVAIAPGLFLSLNALVKGASQLGGISMHAPGHAIGKNTAESMRSGVVLGTASMLDGMLDRFEAELGCKAATIIATGGASQTVAPHCRRGVAYSETLVMDGLYTAYKRLHP